MHREAEQLAAATARTFINLARPGTYGSVGHHLEQRRPREAVGDLPAEHGAAQIRFTSLLTAVVGWRLWRGAKSHP